MQQSIKLILFILLFANSCKVATNSSETLEQDNDLESDITMEESIQDSSFFLPPIQSTPRRIFDLLHTELTLALDWENQAIKGTAQLQLQPYFYPQEYLTLDAKAMDVLSVSLNGVSGRKPLVYKYDSLQLSIQLDREYDRTENFIIEINYVAHPDRFLELFDQSGDLQKGAYFINPLETDSLKPRQFWTHGQTDYNSIWFPTIDIPNERSTQELFITVDTVFTTLSNGILKSSRVGTQGLRTDHWVLDKPHAPYLFSLVVGEFAEYKTTYNGIPLQYYGEKKFGEYLPFIFENTPAMIGLFEQLFGVDYPWPNYKQVAVRDFVAGAMENTTMSIFMEQVQVDQRTLLDMDWDYIIAHELTHQWFGNLVTCESWSQVVLNEGFASYGEYLWEEYAHGLDYGDDWLMQETDTYKATADEKLLPLVRNRYFNPESLFDAHSYSKGALVLHMLRSYLGDDAFFEGLKYYLQTHAYNTVEAEDLRMAFETISGEDLRWFFDQWFYAPGHPELLVEQLYDNDTLYFNVEQVQDLENSPIYQLPFFIDIYFDNEIQRFPVTLSSLIEEYALPVESEPNLIMVDAEYQLLADIYHEKTVKEYQFQYYNAGRLMARFDALENLAANGNDSITSLVMKDALDDPYFRVRAMALEYFFDMTNTVDEEVKNKIISLREDSVASVRGAAIQTLGEIDYEDFKSRIRTGLQDSAYSVVGSALQVLYEKDSSYFESVYDRFDDIDNLNVLAPMAAYYSDQHNASAFEWFRKKISKLRPNEMYYLLQYFGAYLLQSDQEIQIKAVPLLEKLATSHRNTMVRFAAIQGLLLISDVEGVYDRVEQIIKNDKDPELLGMLEGLMVNY